MLNDHLKIFITLNAMIFVCVVTWAWAHHTVATECERLGAFYVNEKTFTCQLKSGDTP